MMRPLSALATGHGFVPCECGWAADLGQHFRFDRQAARPDHAQ
jgi:hypothetical protein